MFKDILNYSKQTTKPSNDGHLNVSWIFYYKTIILIDNAKNLVESLEITISNLKPKIEYSFLSSDDFPF